MSEHTPGPWYHVNDYEVWDLPNNFGGRPQAICTATPEDVGSDEACANARIIASAPTLLAAAQAALTLLEELAERAGGPLAMPYPETEQLRAAIARATGE